MDEVTALRSAKITALKEQSEYYAPPDFTVPEDGVLTIFGTGDLEYTDVNGDCHHNPFGVFVREKDEAGQTKLAFINPTLIPFKHSLGRKALTSLHNALKLALNAKDPEFGLLPHVNEMARKTADYIMARAKAPVTTCHVTNMEWDQESNYLLIDP